MHPRKTIIEMFSTFLQFDADRFSGWATDTKLRRSMQSCISKIPHETTEKFWVFYWYKFLRFSELTRLAKQHLIAYLQESCYWSAQKTVASFTSIQYTLSDYFQMAIAQVDKVFKGFDPNQGFDLKNYANVIFSSVIRETLRQRREVDICTDWGLLRKISSKRLVESLQSAGLSTETITAYVLAWNCFKTLYLPTQATVTRQLSRPDEQTWQAIAQAYNSGSHTNVNPKTLETWLLNSARHARKYLYPSVTSANVSVFNEDAGEWLDNLPDNERDSLINQIITQEEEQSRLTRQSEVNTVLVNAIAQLEPQAQEILQLYYNQGLTQQQIAQQLQIKQYTVSRRLTKARESLLRSLAIWSQDNLHISVTSDLLKSINAVMDEWLQVQYSNPI